MIQLSLPISTINKIVDDPSIIGTRINGNPSTNTSSDTLASLGISQSDAEHILHGYTSGFRTVFILNACLSALATLASILLIKQQDLTRGDEEKLRAEAKAWSEKHGTWRSSARDMSRDEKDRAPGGPGEDIELADRPQSVAASAREQLS